MKKVEGTLIVTLFTAAVLWLSGLLTVKIGPNPGIWLSLPCMSKVSVHRIDGSYTCFGVWAGPRTSPYYPGACDFAVAVEDTNLKSVRVQYRRTDGGLRWFDLP